MIWPRSGVDRQRDAELLGNAWRPCAARDHDRACVERAHVVDALVTHLDAAFLGGASHGGAQQPPVDARGIRMMQRAHDGPEHRHHRSRLVGADLARAARALGHPLPRGNVGVARRELQDAAARPTSLAGQPRDQLVVMPSRGTYELRPRRRRRASSVSGDKMPAPASVARPLIMAIDEHGARTTTAQLVGRGGTD